MWANLGVLSLDSFRQKCYLSLRSQQTTAGGKVPISSTKVLEFSQLRRAWTDGPELYDQPESRKVYLNIPYHPAYRPLEIALCTTLVAYDLVPILARSAARERIILAKILSLVDVCGYGISDLSYAERMNLPFEHGVLISRKGEDRCCAMAACFPPVRDAMSDLGGVVIREHAAEPACLVEVVAAWLTHNAAADIPKVRGGITAADIIAVLPAATRALAQGKSYAYLASRFDRLWLDAVPDPGAA